jgi:hypothetical protein
MPPVPNSSLDFCKSFPSLFVALDRLNDSPYEAGWLLGCVHDVALGVIKDLVCGGTDGQSSRRLYASRVQAFDTICAYGLSNDDRPSSSHASFFNMDELIDTVQRVHIRHLLESWQFPSCFTPINGNPRHQKKIDEVEYAFITNLYGAALDHLYNGDSEHAEATMLDWRWCDGKLFL